MDSIKDSGSGSQAPGGDLETEDRLGVFALEKKLRGFFDLPEVSWTILTFCIERTVRVSELKNAHYPFPIPGIQVVARFSDEMVDLVRNNASFGTLKIGYADSDSIHDVSHLCQSMDELSMADEVDVNDMLTMTDVPMHSPVLGSRKYSAISKINESGLSKLSKALQNNSSLVSVSLALNDIGPAGAIHLNSAICKNHRLRHLNLGMNKLGDEGMSLLFDDWKNNTLYMLNLAENMIQENGAKAIGKFLASHSSGIRELHLSHNNIGKEGGEAIFQSLNQDQNEIRVLSMSSCHIGQSMNALANVLRTYPKLTQLDLSSNEMGDEQCKLLCHGLHQNESLLFLDISVNNLGEDSGIYLGNMLNRNNTLKLLDIGGNHLGDDGIFKLFKNMGESCSLEKMSVMDNNQTEASVDLFYDAKKDLTGLRIRSGLEDALEERLSDGVSPYPAFTPFPVFIEY